MDEEPEKRKWKKVLYESNGFPDNYTDRTFLKDLKRNLKLPSISLLEAIIGSLKVTEELCTVIIFVLAYIYLYNGWIHPNRLISISSCFGFIGFVIYRLFYVNSFIKKLGFDIRTLLIFFLFGQLFSPVLHTLTDTISTNTIYMMSFFMMLIHLIFFDYGVSVALVSNSLSISAAVFASICLASRLASPYEAFVLITIAVKMFVLFPLLRSKISNKVVCMFLIVINTFLLLVVSKSMCFTFCCTVFCINIVCPLLYIKSQSYKDNIYGPWDEAIVEDAENINDLIVKVKKVQ